MNTFKNNKIFSKITVLIIYFIGICGSSFLYDIFKNSLPSFFNNNIMILLILSLLLAIWVFIFSFIFKNNLFKLYWGVVPFWLFLLYSLKCNILNNYYIMIFLGIILIWSLSHLIKWLVEFENLAQKDLIYQTLESRYAKVIGLINLGLFHLLPTAIIFFAMIPGFKYIDGFMKGSIPTLSTWFGFLICVVAIVLKIISEIQYKNSLKISQNIICQKGLWKRSRNPNYFGEILFWVGICVSGISFLNDQNFILITSPIIVLLYFNYVFIPLYEKIFINLHPEYSEYFKNTNKLLIF